MTVKLTVKVRTTGGDNKNVNLGYINPGTTDAVLREFAQKLNGLTSNTLVTITKTTTEDITVEEG